MAACAPLVQDGEDGNVTISLPGGSGGRAVVPSDTLLGRIAYTVTLTGPGGKRTQTLGPGQTQAVFTLAPGAWTVSVTALAGGVPIASGGAEVAVTGKSGQSVSIDLDFYDETEFPPDSTIREVFTVTDLAGWTAAIAEITGTTGNYIVNVTGEVTGITGVSNGSFPGFTGTVSIRGGGALALGSAGSLLYISANQKVVLGDVTLMGITTNTATLVYVGSSASLTMKAGAKISGNTGGGVSVTGNASFTMEGGVISDNNANDGGGVFVNGSSFIMKGGEISGNTTISYGGGVYVNYTSTFTMEGGVISGNTTTSYGGGVCIGGVGSSENSFSKTGGIIYGDTDTTHTPGSTKNTVTDVTYGNTQGHAVAYNFYNGSSYITYYRGADLDEDDDISTDNVPASATGEYDETNWIKRP
jgi:hypothetical protein